MNGADNKIEGGKTMKVKTCNMSVLAVLDFDRFMQAIQ